MLEHVRTFKLYSKSTYTPPLAHDTPSCATSERKTSERRT